MEKKYLLEVTESQLRTIADCVEDCHRFAAGQMELTNTISRCAVGDNYHELTEKLQELQPYITPELPLGSSYNWAGKTCTNDYQRKFIAQTYPIYREILHYFAIERNLQNTYSSETLQCDEGGEIVKIKPLPTKDPEIFYTIAIVNDYSSNVISEHDNFAEAVEMAKKTKNEIEINEIYGDDEITVHIYEHHKDEIKHDFIINNKNVVEEILKK